MNAKQFVAKWKGCTLKERSASQEHFIDLCHLVGIQTPAEADPHGDWFCFERGALKTGGGNGWADVWRRNCFAWEYKGKHKDLTAAFAQLQRYAPALDNPPILVVSDMDTIIIRTMFTNTVMDVHTIALDDIGTPENLAKLKWLFECPERFKPGVTTAEVTETIATAFADLARKLRGDAPYDGFPKHDPQQVAHFLNKLLFCLFAEDIDLLPEGLLTRLLENGKQDPATLNAMLKELFAKMTKGGTFGVEIIEWFNGGLFDGDDVIPLDQDDIARLLSVARAKWDDISPSIFGTLFERGLDPNKRSQLGAHYTDPESINRIIEPAVLAPLQAEWGSIRERIRANIIAWQSGKDDLKKSARDKATRLFKEAQTLYYEFLMRLGKFRILDPACGSGNFLYLSLLALKDFELRVMLDAETLGLERGFPEVGPHCVMGIEINNYAAELARVTIWIGEIQWMRRHAFSLSKNPILKTLNQIECRDAIMNGDGTETEWPDCDAIVGNPPFLGADRMRGLMGPAYTEAVRTLYKDRVPGKANFVCYWFEKARAHIAAGKATRAGLVGSSTIRQAASRPVLERIVETGRIYCAWSDLPWINDGANWNVSFVCFDGLHGTTGAILDGLPVEQITADLTASGAGGAGNLTDAKPLPQNQDKSFFGFLLAGKDFAVDDAVARAWLLDANPNGKPNTDVLKPLYTGDLFGRWRGRWVIDFGITMSEQDAAQYTKPFDHLVSKIKAERQKNARAGRAKYWWRLGETRPGMRRALDGLNGYIATVETAKHRIFVPMSKDQAPEHSLIVIARDDSVTLGVLSSRIHLAWADAKKGNLEDRPRYNSKQCFDTFPFPDGMTPDLPKAALEANPLACSIAAAASSLHEQRVNALKAPGATLTKLYNANPTWLQNAHATLDRTVAAAYGWADWAEGLPDTEIVRRLLALNLARSMAH